MTTQAPSQQQQSRLLSLPRELRDEIYTYYLQEPGGYVHSPTTNKLRRYDGQIIDFSLMWTCKMVASEMRDLPLRVNEVVFKPFQEIKVSREGSDIWDEWSQAGKYDFLLEPLEQLTKEVSEQYPDSCIGDLLIRISKYEDEDYTFRNGSDHEAAV
ncbi:hypothetical protein J4E85_001057 [Alternaria conjuncta]|uniref:uncharacterized protein n=1 Tax=Alternaria conjuncta TaxID=181017 RepID=UPI00221EF91A|nr:uncharacterized protein J4E85_001057 [Alternaria conjuncta]KAI4938616.1 hypothetical protein J4E85_001057 [Alternaria conjuncta]